MSVFALTVGAWLTTSLLCLVIVALIHTHDRFTALERERVGCAVPAREGCLLCELDELDELGTQEMTQPHPNVTRQVKK